MTKEGASGRPYELIRRKTSGPMETWPEVITLTFSVSVLSDRYYGPKAHRPMATSSARVIMKGVDQYALSQ